MLHWTRTEFAHSVHLFYLPQQKTLFWPLRSKDRSDRGSVFVVYRVGRTGDQHAKIELNSKRRRWTMTRHLPDGQETEITSRYNPARCGTEYIDERGNVVDFMPDRVLYEITGGGRANGN